MQQSGFRQIGILGRLGSASVRDTLGRLTQWFERDGIAFRLHQDLATTLTGPLASEAELGAWADLLIVVGGDGTLLGAARKMARYEKPVLGINRGRLGFLTDIMPEELESRVAAVLRGDYMLEHRFLLSATLYRDDRELARATALNDVVLHTGASIRMIEFDLYVDRQFVYRQRSDGLIVSTPTGSTAYALSAGGPLMQPDLDVMSLVPMFPHSLSSRPLLVDGSSLVEIQVLGEDMGEPSVACDAQEHMAITPGDRLRIKKHPCRLHLMHPSDHNYFEICRTKLGWGSRPGAADAKPLD